MINFVNAKGKNIEWILVNLNLRSHLEYLQEKDIVCKIINDIKHKGDMALLEYSRKLDNVTFKSPNDMLVTEEEIKEAFNATSPRYLEILRHAALRIRSFHEKQLSNSWVNLDEEGVILGQRIQPIEKVGVYVPGGRASYPSSVLMNVIPAKVAGVQKIVMATPPQDDGKVNPAVLVAAAEAGVHRIYKVGGAQAIASLAFGTDTIPRVDKIVGPGNIFVALAKKEVYGYVDIDMIAGPSEVLIIADNSANPSYVAADLLSQAEHDPMASAILVTNSLKLAQNVKEEIRNQVQGLSKKKTIHASLENYGALITVDSIEQAIDLANCIAPEHLELAVDNPFDLVGKVNNAGALFLGHYSPEPLGDYMAGPNHVLPTSGTARFFSPLSVDDFIKKSSIISFTQSALKKIYKDVIEFACAEGLTAHANSIEIRFKRQPESSDRKGVDND